jgi:hypothetical protein
MCHAVWLCAGLLACTLATAAAQPAGANRPAPTPAVIAEYKRLLDEYTRVHDPYEREAVAYWSSISEKRKLRAAKRRDGQVIVLEDYVLSQPPVYAGPPKPIDPAAPDAPTPQRTYVPVVADFLQSAAEHFKFVPTRPQSEIEFKQAYAKAAAAAGLAKDQVVRIYGFEVGGNGGYDVQAGLEVPRPGARAITTALGYNQLLHINSVELLAEQGDRFIKVLNAKAATLTGDARKLLERKIEILRQMIAFCRTVPDAWSEHDRLASTPKGLGIHALNLDIDVAPLLQTQKLLDSVLFARMKGFKGTLTAAELEMMNLTGDGNGFDMVSMPLFMRDKVPTSNFFLQQSWQRNTVAVRNDVVSKLIAATNARMDLEMSLPGARALAAAFGS